MVFQDHQHTGTQAGLEVEGELGGRGGHINKRQTAICVLAKLAGRARRGRGEGERSSRALAKKETHARSSHGRFLEVVWGEPLNDVTGRKCDFLSAFNDFTVHSLVTAYLCQLPMWAGRSAAWRASGQTRGQYLDT